jgi:hypothetical protein
MRIPEPAGDCPRHLGLLILEPLAPLSLQSNPHLGDVKWIE